jgi:two-component system, OmpR family, response regulator ChvI
VSRVLIVEDESAVRDALDYSLRGEGFDVDAAADGEAGLRAAQAGDYDVVILDLMLPKMSGTEVCRRLRTESAVPIIMLTAKGAELDRVLGLEIGADDYLCKPFSMRELMARVKVLLRRASAADIVASSGDERPIVCGALTIDPLRLTVVWEGRPVPLTVTEILLLQGLVRRPGIVKTREQLMVDAYPDRVSVSDRTIDSHVKRIRRKFQTVDAAFDCIEGVYGAGYRYRVS